MPSDSLVLSQTWHSFTLTLLLQSPVWSVFLSKAGHFPSVPLPLNVLPLSTLFLCTHQRALHFLHSWYELIRQIKKHLTTSEITLCRRLCPLRRITSPCWKMAFFIHYFCNPCIGAKICNPRRFTVACIRLFPKSSILTSKVKGSARKNNLSICNFYEAQFSGLWFDKPFDRQIDGPFDMLTVLSNIDGLTAQSNVVSCSRAESESSPPWACSRAAFGYFWASILAISSDYTYRCSQESSGHLGLLHHT
jgi:hypothetical protein